MDKYLSDAVKKIRGRMTIHLNRVDKYLDTLDRVAIATDGGYNNLFKAIRMQLHVPKCFRGHYVTPTELLLDQKG